MSSIRIFVCEDDELILQMNQLVLEDYIKKRKIDADIIYRNHYEEQDEELLKGTEIAILDIDLVGRVVNGIELAKRVQKNNPEIVFIFITAYEEFALEATKIHLSGFLVKPLNQYDFKDVLDRAIVQVNGYRIVRVNHRVITFQNDKIALKERNIISIEKITNTHQVKIYTTEKELRAYDSIRDIEKRISDSFVKLNCSVMVNLSFIFNIENSNVYMKDGTKYEVSVRNLKKVRKAYEEHISKKLV